MSCSHRTSSDRAVSKAFASKLDSATHEQVFHIVDLVAAGDVMVARLDYQVTVPDGTTTTARGYVLYRLSEGTIRVAGRDEGPDLTLVLARL